MRALLFYLAFCIIQRAARQTVAMGQTEVTEAAGQTVAAGQTMAAGQTVNAGLETDASNATGEGEEWTGYTGPAYRKEIFPPTPPGEPLEVGVSVQVRNLPKIDENDGVLGVELNLRVRWRDARLRTPPSLGLRQYAPLDPAVLAHIWVPDLYFDHSEGAVSPTVLTQIASVWIYGDATVDYSGNMFVRVSCPMNYKWFPRDHQICDVKMESCKWRPSHCQVDAYTLERNVYVWVAPALEVSDSIHSEQFMVTIEKTKSFTRVQDVYGSYPALSFRVHLTRRLTYMLLQVYLPSGLFVVVSFVSLVVPAEAIPGRMTLCITTILTLSTLLGVNMQSTPRVSYVRAIDAWLLSCLTFVTLVLLEFGLVIKLQELAKLGSGATTSILTTPGTVKVATTNTVAPLEATTPPTWNDGGGGGNVYLARARQVDGVAALAFPSTFLLFNLAYWWWFLAGSAAAIPTLNAANCTT